MKPRVVLAASTLCLTALLLVSTGMTSAPGYKEVAVTDGGRITGRVTFEGPLPDDAVEQITINKNPEVCDLAQALGYREVTWVDVKDGALLGTFVFLYKVKVGKPWPPPPDGKYVILQQGCRFHPWAQVVRQGDIYIRHADQGVQHNINMVELIGVEKKRAVARPMINRNQPEPGVAIEELRTVRSPFIAINCQVHNFMFSYLMAPKHPYAVVVNEDGSYSLDKVPPGDYTLKAWHPRLGIQKTKITVPANGEVIADFVYSKPE